MGGVIGLTLTACTTDSVYDDINEQNNEMVAPPSFNDLDSGQYGPNPGYNNWGIDYISPWDVWFRKSNVNGHIDLQPSYLFTNGNMEDVTPYNITVFAYAGLAYFDGDNDGTYRDPYIALNDPTNPTGFVAQIDNGTYPNLYANNQEVGNLIKTVVPINVPAYPTPNSSFRIEDKIHHLPTNNVITPTAIPKYSNPNFNFGTTTTTANERSLLARYGKIFFYEVQVFNKTTGALVLSTFMHPKISTLPSGQPWEKIEDPVGTPLLAQTPMGNFDMYFLNANLPGGTYWIISNPSSGVNKCDSREVVFNIPESAAPSRVQIDPQFKLMLGIQATGQTGWVNSALHLYVTGR